MMDKPKILAAIVAMGENREIGQTGDMPWKRGLRRDLAYFKEITMGCPIIMGRKTFQSLPKAPLPGRKNIVLSKHGINEVEDIDVYNNIDDALKSLSCQERVFVIGGANVYEQTMPYCDELYVSLVHNSFPDADRFFPRIGKEWQIVSEVYFPADEKNIYPVSFIKYVRQ